MTAEKPAEKKVDHKTIYAALSAFQGELKPMKKSGKVSFGSGDKKVEYTYTPLGEIMETIYPLMAKHGLSARHETVRVDAKDYVVAVVSHESAQFVEVEQTTKTLAPDGLVSTEITGKTRVLEGEIRSGLVAIAMSTSNMKDTGASITYARRYSLTMALGIASEEDLDVSIMEQSGKNAISYAMNRAKKGLDEAKTEKEVEKAMKLLKSELEGLEKGKAGALGLSKDQYESLIAHGEVRLRQIKEGITVEPTGDAHPEEGSQDSAPEEGAAA